MRPVTPFMITRTVRSATSSPSSISTTWSSTTWSLTTWISTRWISVTKALSQSLRLLYDPAAREHKPKETAMAPPQRPVRLSDVAATAGVSLATASRALNGQNGVGPILAARVREGARTLGYIANVHARTLAGGATSVVGLIVHEIDDPYFTEIAGGVIRSALAKDLLVQVSHSGRDPEQELRQI